MSTTRSVEITGSTIEEAIDTGLQELLVSRESVIVEILEEPSRGILGLGAKQARVRLTTAARPKTEEVAAPKFVESPPRYQPAPSKRRDEEEEEEEDFFAPAEVKIIDEADLTDDARAGRDKLKKLLDLMEIEAEVVVEGSQDATDEEATLVLQIQGDDLGGLIGRKGETLSALQYLTRLITSHELQRRVSFVVDAGGYKAKRAETLHRLAERMANQAVERQRTVKLEPMPPHERRIIHVALRKREDVTTRSVGEGDLRKVTIIPRD